LVFPVLPLEEVIIMVTVKLRAEFDANSTED
jgi:hypothetical protein